MTDYAYETARNRLIPSAINYADTKHGPIAPPRGSEREVWYASWNQSYHAEVGRLSKEYNLTN